MYQKTFGYLLLSAGIFAIILSTLSFYEISIGRKKPPQVISQQGIAINLSALLKTSADNIPSDNSETNQLELLSAHTITTTLNIGFYLIGMSFISASGFKVATLGVQLLRPINIHSSVLS